MSGKQMGLVYISGPMGGLPKLNFPAFNDAAKRLRRSGFAVVNPAELDAKIPKAQRKDWEWSDYLRRDIAVLMRCECVVVLPNWEKSRGARLEVQTAKGLGMMVYTYVPTSRGKAALGMEVEIPVEELETITEEAGRIVNGARQGDYGHPADDFARTGRIWAAILGVPCVTPEQVGLCMVGVKLSREVNKPKRDNRVDIAGYAETLQLVSEWRETSTKKFHESTGLVRSEWDREVTGA